jgi:predicted ATPase
MVPYFYALLAETYGKAGQIEEVLSSLSEAIAVVTESGQKNFEAELYQRGAAPIAERI